MRVLIARLLLAATPLAPTPLLAQRVPVEGRHGMVSSAHHLASAAGIEVMRAGGNAVDAAVATGFALAVVFPRAGNLGGGGFMIVHTSGGADVALDFREVAPLAATATLFQDEAGNVVPGRSLEGYLANGVPGTVAGLGHAWERYGSGNLSWHDVLEPARRLAAEGFEVSDDMAQGLRASQALLGSFPTSATLFLRDGDFYAAGERFVQPDLAATLARLQAEGAAEFYHGHTADLIADDQAAHGGLITRADLAAYAVVERTPIRTTYRGYDIVAMPPPSSGGIALQQMLGMLEPHDLRGLGLHSAAYIHVVTEAMRRAFRDRAEFLGDPAFTPVPTDRLTDADYIAGMMTSFDPVRATLSDTLGPGGMIAAESFDTTHFSVVDADGNAASCTYTLNGLYGNGVTVPGAGFLLNNEMDDFTAKVGVKNFYGLLQGEANAVAPGKRPLSSMTPTIVLRDGRPFLLAGAPGGPTIITSVLQVLLNVIDFEMPLVLAVDAPRFHHQWQPDQIYHEPFLASPDTFQMLEAMGHTLALRRLYPNQIAAAARYFGDAQCILVEPESGLLLGVNDTRSQSAGAVGF